jgi:hypothetical protein
MALNTKCPLFDGSVAANTFLKMNSANTKILGSGIATLVEDLGWAIPLSNDMVNVEAAIDEIPSGGTLYILPNMTCNITDNWVVPNNVTVYVPPYAMFNISSGKQIDFANGSLQSGTYQIFTGAGTVSGLTESIPEWFPSSSVQNALDALTDGGICYLGNATYSITNVIITNANTTLQGNGWGAVLQTSLSHNTATLPPLWVQANGTRLKDFKITWDTMPNSQDAFAGATSVENNDTISIGWLTYGTGGKTIISDTVVEDVYVYGAKQHGISIGCSDNTKIINNRVEEAYATGIWPMNASNLEISGNFIYRTMDAGIDPQTSLVPVGESVNVVVKNNLVKNTLVGIGSHGSKNVVIEGNTIDGTWSAGIYCQGSIPLGVGDPYVTNVSNNTLVNLFKFYGTGNFHALDYYTTIGTSPAIIEVYSPSEVTIAGNTIKDDSGLYTHHLFHASGTLVTITGNTAKTDAVVGLYTTPGIATAYDQIESLVISGNNLSLANGHGAFMLFLGGVASGTITGNYFDCGGQGLSDPSGRFVLSSWSKDVLISGNTVVNCTGNEYSDSGNSSNITFKNNKGLKLYTQDFATGGQMSDIANAINTADKYYGKNVWDYTMNRMYYAGGFNAGDPWYDAQGLATYTPGGTVIIPPAPTGTPPSVTTVLDNFNRADENPLAGNWGDNPWGFAPRLKIVSNEVLTDVVPPAYGYAGAVNTSLSCTDVEIIVPLTTLPGIYDNVVLLARHTLANGTGYEAEFYMNTASTISVMFYKWIPYRFAQAIGARSSIVPITAGDKLAFQVIGSNLYAWVYHSGSWGTTPLGTIADTTYGTAGLVGFGYGANGTAAVGTFTEFIAESLD